MNDIKEFRGKYHFLSNFFERSIIYKGITYKNNEAAFQSMKSSDRSVRLSFSNLDASTAKIRGRKVHIRSLQEWDNIKDRIMHDVVLTKFAQHPDLRKRLLETGDAYLEEGNYWHDNHFGNCYCDRCKNIYGKNKLGKILMEIRGACREDALS